MSYIKAAYEITDDVVDHSRAIDGTFVLLFVFTAVVRIFQSLNTQVIEIDSYTIIETAKTFGNLSSLSLKDFAVNVHPLFPFLMAILSRCGISYEAAGTMLSVLFGSLTVFPVYLMSASAYGRRVGYYSVFLFAVHPYLLIDASNVLRDSMNIFFMVMTFYIAWKGFDERKDRYLVLSGCTAALAYLTKAEGFFCILAVLLYIWTRDPRGKQTTIRERARSTLSFASISLMVAVSLMIIFSLKTHGFSLSTGKPFGSMSLFSPSPMGLNNELKVLGGITTGLTTIDMTIAFIFILFEAVFTIFILFLGLNVVRVWTGKALSPIERYNVFIIMTLLILDLIYFSQFHLFSRRYFLCVVVLLMGFMGYGMRLFEARFENYFRRKNLSIFFRKAPMVIFIIGIIILGLIKGSYYWKYDRVSLKISGEYIVSHFGKGRTVLADDPRIAYYADGSYHALTEDALLEITKQAPGACYSDFIVFYRDENLPLYEKYKGYLADSGFVGIVLPLSPESNKIIMLRCLKNKNQ